jgi:hypothetical protein
LLDRKIEFLDEFQHIINETLESGVAAFLRHEDYRYYCGLNWPKKPRRESKYAILFRACLAQVIDTVGHIPLGQEPRLRDSFGQSLVGSSRAVRKTAED